MYMHFFTSACVYVQCTESFTYMDMFIHALYAFVHVYMLGTDLRITSPVLKPSDGFKASNPTGGLDIRPNGFEAGQTAC